VSVKFTKMERNVNPQNERYARAICNLFMLLQIPLHFIFEALILFKHYSKTLIPLSQKTYSTLFCSLDHAFSYDE
jgi:hypothetical protein